MGQVSKIANEALEVIFGLAIVLIMIAYFLGSVGTTNTVTNGIINNVTSAINKPVGTVVPNVITILFVVILLGALVGVYLYYRGHMNRGE